MRCTATIEVGGTTVECIYDGPDEHHLHGRQVGDVMDDAYLSWNDGVPGSTPHQRPRLTYEAVEGAAGWRVYDQRRAGWIVHFDPSHPDPEGAAKAEVARLNGEATGDTAANLLAERDEARERVAVLETALRECEVDHLTSEGADDLQRMHEFAVEQRDEARAERDRFRKALEYIKQGGSYPHVRGYARRVLDGGRP